MRCAVLGDPIGHSLSPVIHRAAYDALGLDGWEYDAVQVPAGGLAAFVDGLDPDEWRGLSLTMPLKREAVPLLDTEDDWVRLTSVCNTVVLDPDGANVLKAIGDRHLLDVIQFTQQTGDLPREWDKLKPVFDELTSKPAGNAFTDLKQPLVRAIERGGSGEGKLLGVVVLTDGQHNWGQSPLNKARELGQRGVPVYLVGVGAKEPPPRDDSRRGDSTSR